MSYNGRKNLAQHAADAGWTVIPNMFVQEAPIYVEFDQYAGANGDRVLIGWDVNNCAPYVATKTAADERLVQIKGATSLIAAVDFIRAHAVVTA
jgi:hypothetical protein